jgi:hypothetical protein
MDIGALAKDQVRRILTKDLDDAQDSLNRLMLMIGTLDDSDPRKAELLELHKRTAESAIELKEYMLANFPVVSPQEVQYAGRHQTSVGASG